MDLRSTLHAGGEAPEAWPGILFPRTVVRFRGLSRPFKVITTTAQASSAIRLTDPGEPDETGPVRGICVSGLYLPATRSVFGPKARRTIRSLRKQKVKKR